MDVKNEKRQPLRQHNFNTNFTTSKKSVVNLLDSEDDDEVASRVKVPELKPLREPLKKRKREESKPTTQPPPPRPIKFIALHCFDKLYQEHVALKSENDNLKKRNEQLLAAYQEQKAKCDEHEAKANAIKESNKREAQKCVELGDYARESKDYAKAEKFYKKAARLDLGLNFNDLMHLIKLAKEAELREREEAEKKKRNEQEGVCYRL